MEELYKKYSKLVYNYLYSLTADMDLAEELMQETFYSAIKNINKFNHECKISVWLCQIAKNKYIDELRKNKETISLDEYMEKSLNDIHAIFAENIDSSLIKKEEKKPYITF